MVGTTFDCDTPEGKKYLEHEQTTSERIGKAKNYHPFVFGTGSRIDRLYYDDDANVRALCEIRSRNKSLDDLRVLESVLCNRKKLDEGAQAARLFNVDFYLFIRTLKDDQIIYCKIADKDGKFIAEFETKKQKMQKSCNGGIEEKEIAYIDIGQWTKLKESSN